MLVEIRIDEATWSFASPARKREWRQAIAEILEHQSVPQGIERPRRRMCISRDSGDNYLLELELEDGAPLQVVVLDAQLLSPHFGEYFEICRIMSTLQEGSQSARLEALDMAKRVAHDRAAQALLSQCGALGSDHATCRALFTLFICLHFDTANLGRAQAHALKSHWAKRD